MTCRRCAKRRAGVVDHQEVFAGLTVDEAFGMQHFPVDLLRAAAALLEASIAFHPRVFQREQPWLVFSPHALAQHRVSRRGGINIYRWGRFAGLWR